MGIRYIKIESLLKSDPKRQTVGVRGWVRTFRNQRFIALNDGSTIKNLQIVVDAERVNADTIARIITGACLCVEGELVASIGKGQEVELFAVQIDILGDSDAQQYPLQPKKHSLEFLRGIAHLRPRANVMGAITRIRHAAAFAIHCFFNDRNFLYIHTPIITGSDAEGAGAMFRVTTLKDATPPLNHSGKVDYAQDFFGQQVSLTVSGQLEAEAYALSLGNVYTFGPTFRAENSNTKRHLAEFWMVEPEMAFYNLYENMKLAEDLLQYLMRYVLNHCPNDLSFLDARNKEEEQSRPKNQRSSLGLLERLAFVADNEFERMTYTEAIAILKKSKHNKKGKFQYPVEQWGMDLQSEHERFLVENYAKKPVIIYDYPSDIKAFYMRRNEDNKTVAAMDVLFPFIGEMVGGSQREERYDVLLATMQRMQLSEEELSWYLDLRRFGSAPHSGFGLGFDRLMLYLTGMNNIRDVIPFPRFPGHALF